MIMGAPGMKVLPVACLSDNYAYLVVCEATGEAAVVDPSEPEPVVRAAAAAHVEPRAIWNTHHHHDHTGGNEALADRWGITEILAHGSDRGRIAGQTRSLQAGERFALGELGVEILHVPGHTLGAVAYVVRSRAGEVAMLTGDTMFHAGCGRLFEGTAAQMHASLQSLAAQGDDARVFPGHEYTLQNLRFAQTLEPHSEAVTDALAEARALRDRAQPTVGTTIARERETNPFLRTGSSEVRRRLGVDASASDVAALAAIRAAKDAFR
jgi:hydroxyacylglutathione hydrolase